MLAGGALACGAASLRLWRGYPVQLLDPSCSTGGQALHVRVRRLSCPSLDQGRDAPTPHRVNPLIAGARSFQLPGLGCCTHRQWGVVVSPTGTLRAAPAGRCSFWGGLPSLVRDPGVGAPSTMPGQCRTSPKVGQGISPCFEITGRFELQGGLSQDANTGLCKRCPLASSKALERRRKVALR